MILKLVRFFCLAAILCVVTAVYAHGPTPQKLNESIKVDVPPEKVWSVIKDFGAIDEWHPLIVETRAQGGNEATEATRVLTFKNGGTIKDLLDVYNASDHYMMWRLAEPNKKAFPVSFYTIRLDVNAAGNGSKVEWTGRFYRAVTTRNPPEKYSDAAAVEAMTEFAHAGLKNIKRLAEKGD